MTADAFLAWEAAQPTRHEFSRGEIFAMTGATERPVLAAGNLLEALRRHLRGTPCRAMGNDMKLHIAAADCFYYPDILVSCQPSVSGNDSHKTDALLLAEVLSPSTAAFDRGDKFADYRLLPGLKEYLLVDAERRRCDLYRKGSDGLWVLHPCASDEAVQLASVGLAIQPDTLWEDLPPLPPAAAG